MAITSLKFYKTITFILTVAVGCIFPVKCAPDDLQCPNQYNSSVTLVRLKQQMLCKYDRWVRPVKKVDDTIKVDVKMFVRTIDFDDKTDTITVHSQLQLTWKDYQIMWKPEDFDGIKKMRVNNWNIWNPDIAVLSSIDASGYSPFMYAISCIVYFNGNVFCVPPLVQKSNCFANIKYWPYDTHNCRITMCSWTHLAKEVNLTLSDVRQPLDLRVFQANREWLLINNRTLMTNFTVDEDDYFSIVNFEFKLERHSGSYAAIVIIPAVALMFVTLTTYWMDPNQAHRLILAVTSIVSHFLFLQFLGNILPSNGNETPLIVTFYRDSLIMTAMAFMVAIVVHRLRTSSQNIPVWASNFSSWILQNRFGQFIVFHNLNPKAVAVASETSGDEDADNVNSTDGSSKSGWHTFSIILDFLFFGITLFIYFILLLGFIP